ncbi:MAG: T9SS type A sorting domain-containing protein [Bacteroidales bacterium]|jgi:hypothetical protein|nr:T9SS type A sorting domain-containing protein [Bacteroidales bacterium]
MKITERTFLLICIFLLTVFAKMDINSAYNVPIAAYSVCAADLDLNGDKDLVIGHRTAWQHFNPAITIMENINNGILEITDTSKIFAGYQENIFAIDVNNDASPDIVTFYLDFASGVIKRYIRVFYNSNGTFQNYTDFSLNSSATFSDITYGDVDGNGYPDLIVSSNGGQLWGVLYNDGNGNFSTPEYQYVTDTNPTGLACGDLNNDSRDDIIVFGAKVEIFYSLASGLQEVLLCEQKANGWIEDFNHDGKKDIVSFSDLSLIGLTAVTIFENTGSGNFIKHDEIVFPFSTSEFYLSDFNNDSLPDVLFKLMNKTGHVIYFNQGGFQLADSTFVAVSDYGEQWRKCCCADLDGNGYNDIVTIRTSYAKLPANVDIKFNDGHGHFIDHPLGIPDKKTIGEFEITNIFPNPFINQTCIEILLSETEIVNLTIYDISGRLISDLLNSRMTAGKHKVIWKRIDHNGKACKSGIYFAILRTQSTGNRILKIVAY